MKYLYSYKVCDLIDKTFVAKKKKKKERRERLRFDDRLPGYQSYSERF